MNHGDLQDLIYQMMDDWWAARHVERHGLVTSYDPKTYHAKVTFQPDGQESGWLPIEAPHIGTTYGIVIGLQPGQGGVNTQGQGGSVGPQSQNQGDQVVVRFQEGDFESGKITQRLHSDQDSPPQVQSGEVMLYTRFQKSGGGTPDSAQGAKGGTGQQIYFKNDGSISWTDGNGASIKFDGNGNIIMKCKKLQLDASDVVTMISSRDFGVQGSNVEINAQGTAGISGGTAVLVQDPGSVSDGSVQTPANQVGTMPPTKFTP